MSLSSKRVDGYDDIITRIREELSVEDPGEIAVRTGSSYHHRHGGLSEFHLTVWKRNVIVTYPEFSIVDADTGEKIKGRMQGVLLYYFLKSDGEPEGGKWLSLAELPNGMFYRQAYQGYTGDRLIREFKNDLRAFEHSALNLGGLAEPYGDTAYSFQALPRVKLMAVYWIGDEEFSPSAQILFDSSSSHYLPTDVCAVLGSVLTDKLIRGD